MILIVPAAQPGRGGGHLTRCVTLAKDLRAAGKQAFLFLSSQTDNVKNLIQSMNFDTKWCVNNEESGIRSEEFEFIILDRFQTSAEELLRWKKIAPVIGIDEGGKRRDSFDFLIDILVPEKFGKPPANIASAALLFKNSNRVSSNQRFAGFSEEAENRIKKTKILITFGQEDPAGLGIKTANKILKTKNNNQFDITLIKGALTIPNSQFLIPNSSFLIPNSSFLIPNSIKALDAIPNLAEHLSEYDIIITHYGLTAYEALFAPTQVLLAHPTKYHKKLAKAAGFNTFSIKTIKSITNFTTKHTNQHVQSKKLFRKKSLCGLRLKNQQLSLAELISSFSPIINKNCPVCGKNTQKQSIARFCDRTYRRCRKCGIIYMDRINPAPVEYEKEYFFEFYKKQYGKTYLEDFNNIKKSGKNRLKIILKILSRKDAKAQEEKNNFERQTLLDIGCAYGPFLAAAKEEGLSPTGIDPAQDAVRYVQEKLAVPAIQSIFPIPNSPFLIPHSYDIITMWYVIEHFKDCVCVLAEIKKLLKPDGILAFSTPSFSGISGRANLRKFLSASPADHFTVWSPKTAKKALALAGFKVKKTVVAGHHPERFPVLGKFAKNKESVTHKLLLAVSKIFKLGDTFEVYAVNN